MVFGIWHWCFTIHVTSKLFPWQIIILREFKTTRIFVMRTDQIFCCFHLPFQLCKTWSDRINILFPSHADQKDTEMRFCLWNPWQQKSILIDLEYDGEINNISGISNIEYMLYYSLTNILVIYFMFCSPNGFVRFWTT